MSIAQNKALENQIFSGKVETDKAYILSSIMKKDSTIEDLESIFTMKTATIVGRVSELENAGLIYAKSIKDNKSLYTYQADSEKQAAHIVRRKIQRFKKWQNKAKEFEGYLGEELFNKINNID